MATCCSSSTRRDQAVLGGGRRSFHRSGLAFAARSEPPLRPWHHTGMTDAGLSKAFEKIGLKKFGSRLGGVRPEHAQRPLRASGRDGWRGARSRRAHWSRKSLMPREEGRRGEGEREHSHIILGFGDGTMLRLLLVGWLWRLLALDGMH